MSDPHHRRHHRSSRRGERDTRRHEVAPVPEYDPRYSHDEPVPEQPPGHDPYSTDPYCNYDNADLENQFSHMSIEGQQDPHYTHQPDPETNIGEHPYVSYAYPSEHSADPGSYSYETGAYETNPSDVTQPRMSDDPGHGFDSILEEAHANAYGGGAYPNYEDEYEPGPSGVPYGSPDAQLDPIPEHGFLAARSRDGSRDEMIDMSQFRLEHSSEFTPGTIFKLVWPEPLGETARPRNAATQATQRVEVTPEFYAGIRRFIVVTSGDGNSSCIPILTYERRACTKRGVNPETHGIIHGAGQSPRSIRHEPRLGVAPVAANLISGERLATESRVNYAKLQTIEHNVKVRIIGRITHDIDTVLQAVDDCWQRRTHQPSRRNRSRR